MRDREFEQHFHRLRSSLVPAGEERLLVRLEPVAVGDDRREVSALSSFVAACRGRLFSNTNACMPVVLRAGLDLTQGEERGPRYVVHPDLVDSEAGCFDGPDGVAVEVAAIHRPPPKRVEQIL